MTEISRAAQVARLGGDVVSVKDFGAVGDGVTDDTAAIQAAIDSLSIGDVGGTVYLPIGDYSVDSLTHRNRVSLVGAGINASRLLARPSSALGVITLEAGQVTNADIRKLSVVGNASNTNQWGLFMDQQDDGGVGGWWLSTIQDVDVRGVNYGISIRGGSVDALHPTQFITLRNVVTKRNNFNGISLQVLGQAGQFYYEKCLFDGVGGTTLGTNVVLDDVGSGLSGTHIFEACSFQNSDKALSVESIDSVLISNCWFENVSTSLTFSGECFGCVADGNRFANAGSTEIVNLSGTSHLSFTNNYVLGTVTKLATVSTDSMMMSESNRSSVNTTTGVTKQLAVVSNTIDCRNGNTFVVNTSTDEIATISSNALVGERLFLKALAGSIVLNNTGNIKLGTESSPLTIPNNKVIELVKFDLSGEWHLVNT